MHVMSLMKLTENGRRLVENFISLSVLKGFDFIIPLIILPYLVNVLGIAGFGLVNFSLSLAVFFGAVIQYGFAITATREIARCREDKQKISEIFSTTMTLQVGLSLLMLACFSIIVMGLPFFHEYLSLYFASLVFIIFQSLFPAWFFQGMEKMKFIALLSFFSKLLFFIFLLSFVKQAEDLIWVPLLQGLSALMILALALYLIRYKFDVLYILPSWNALKMGLYSGHFAFISQFTPNLYNNATTFILGVFTSPAVVGYYTAATRLIDAFISVGTILSQTFLPYLSRFIQQHFAFQTLMWIVGAGLALFMFLSADLLVLWMFGETYQKISDYIQWLAVSILLIFVVQAYGTNFLMLVGKEAIVRNIALYTSVFYLFVALALIPVWGIYGAIFTLVMARATMAGLNFGYYVRYGRALREGGRVG